MHNIKDIQYGNQVHPDINSREARLKIHDHIRQSQSEWKGA